MAMDLFFSYSHLTASKCHSFPSKIINVYDNPIHIDKLTERYNFFLLSIETVYDDQAFNFLYQLKRNLKKNLKILYKDIKILILCPCEKNKLINYIKTGDEDDENEDIFYWIVSPSLAKHLSLYITPRRYYGQFLFSIESNLQLNKNKKSSSLYWRLLSHCDDNMEWFLRYIESIRTDWENQCQMIYKDIHKIINNDSFFYIFSCQHGSTKRSPSSSYHSSLSLSFSSSPSSPSLSSSPSSSSYFPPTWGWLVLPLEIQHVILNHMEISDILLCYQASFELKRVVIPWLYEHIQHKLQLLKNNHLSIKELQYNVNYLNFLYFHLYPFLEKDHQSLETINL